MPGSLQLAEGKAEASQELHGRVMDLARHPAPFFRLTLDHRMAEFLAHLAEVNQFRHVIAGNRRKGPASDLKPVDAKLEGISLPAVLAVIDVAERSLPALLQAPNAFCGNARRLVALLRSRLTERQIVRSGGQCMIAIEGGG